MFWAAFRSGLYLTAVNHHLTAKEAGYIIDNCDAEVLVMSAYKGDLATATLEMTPKVKRRLMVDGTVAGFESYEEAIAQYPAALARLNLDLAIAPLEQNLFNECKSNLRLLEYGACGYPVVCSDVGPYRSGLPVTRVRNRTRDWVDAIRAHLCDLDATARAGDNLRTAVLDGWMLGGGHLHAWRKAWLPD